tara:strand:- start:465 stop:1241 length:777 start_codon:yes stop_codon:yes gene_type:complete
MLLREQPNWAARQGFGTMRVQKGSTMLHFPQPVVEPLHIFFRYSNSSRHDVSRLDATPEIGTLSFYRTLLSLSRRQLDQTKLTLQLDRASSRHQTWFESHFGRLRLREFNTHIAPRGNEAGYIEQSRLLLRETDPLAIIFLIEADYLHRADMLMKTVEFFAAYNPCMAAPYDSPDRYLLDDMNTRALHAQNVVLKGKGIHWRTVDSTTVTYAVRRHVVDDVLTMRGHRGMPGPLGFMHDCAQESKPRTDQSAFLTCLV